MTPSVSDRWMHGKLLVARTVAAAINLQILSLDENEHAKLVEKAKLALLKAFGVFVNTGSGPTRVANNGNCRRGHLSPPNHRRGTWSCKFLSGTNIVLLHAQSRHFDLTLNGPDAV